MVSTLRREEDTAARHMIYPESQVERSHHRMQSPGREQQDEKKKKEASPRECVLNDALFHQIKQGRRRCL
jgi:hypothetical protein